MLVIDGNNHEVYEVDASCIWTSPDHRPVRVPFEKFEAITTGPSYPGLFARLLLHRRSITALKLCGTGFAWGAQISVVHDGQLPIPDAEFGSDFLFVWPAATSIHAFFALQEAARRAGGDATASAVEGVPRPSMSFRPHGRTFGSQDVPLARRVAPHELTVAQRLFLAGLATSATPFPTRCTSDTWAQRMERRDTLEFRKFGARRLVAALLKISRVRRRPQVSGPTRQSPIRATLAYNYCS